MKSRRRVNSTVRLLLNRLTLLMREKRSEERRVGKECRSRRSPSHCTTEKPISTRSKQPEYVTDPTCCGLMEGIGRQGIDVAWHSFTKDGRFRLARKDDFKSVARAFGSDDPLNRIFAFCSGRLAYEPYPIRR